MANDSKDSSHLSTSRGNCTCYGSGAFQTVGHLFITAGVFLIATKFNLSIRILCFVDLAFLYNLVNRINLVHNFSQYVCYFSLYVSGNHVPIIRRKYHTYAITGICHSIWITVW